MNELWLDYALMKAGLKPWEVPVLYRRTFSVCNEAEARKQDRAFNEARMRSLNRRMLNG